MLDSLNVGLEPAEQSRCLEDFGYSTADALSITEDWRMCSDRDYCPFSDIPESAARVGVHVMSDHLWLVGVQNMMGHDTLVGFRFSR